jgi:hypothetical protein
MNKIMIYCIGLAVINNEPGLENLCLCLVFMDISRDAITAFKRFSKHNLLLLRRL